MPPAKAGSSLDVPRAAWYTESMETLLADNLSAVEDYITYLTSVRMVSQRTSRAYLCDLSQMAAWFATRSTALLSVTHEDARRYASHLMRLGRKQSTVDRKLATARSFYRHGYKRGMCPTNPFSRIQGTARGRKLPSVLSEQEVKRIIETEPTDFHSLRDVLMFNVLYATGCRLAELLGLNLNDIELDQHRVLLKGKGNKERYAFFTPLAIRLLLEYLPQRQSWVEAHATGHPEKALFVNDQGNRLTASSVHGVFRKYQLRHGITKRFTPHVFRHSFATHMLDHDSGIRIVQELLGHASIATTQIYSHVSNERLKRVHAECHPHGRKK